MNIIVNDKVVLGDVGPLAIAAFLQSNGAVLEHEDEGLALWSFMGDELVVPSTTEFKDYPSRVYDILAAISKKQGKSQFEVLRDLQSVAYDVLRMPKLAGADQHYNVPFEAGLQAINSMHELMLGSAYATLEKRAMVPSRRPKPVVDYMAEIKLGQYLNGKMSYALLSPLPSPDSVALQTGLFEGVPPKLHTPYQRRVLVTMIDVVNAASDAAYSYMQTGSLQPFEDTVAQGVNSTICDAIADLIDTDPERGISLKLHWSPRLSGPEQNTVLVESGQDSSVYRTASKRLREIAERQDHLVVGIVVGLRQEVDEKAGRATIAASFDGAPRHVVVDLNEQDYPLAYDAHGGKQFVSVLGTLKREGNTYRLRSAYDFRVIGEPFVS